MANNNNPNFPNVPEEPIKNEPLVELDQDEELMDDEVPELSPKNIPEPPIQFFYSHPMISKKKFSLASKQLDLDQITTEGLTVADLEKTDYPTIKAHIKGCSFCGKYYKSDMFIPTLEKDDEISCWHCFFWMNYATAARKNVDGIYGMTIVDYILRCSAIHETTKCQRNSDSGGCFLCEYNLGLPITDIKDLHRLGSSHEIPEKPFEDDDHIDIDPSLKTEQITVFI
ncbi:MAG: hypothetical protein Hyperionvirus9_8 [Hyperionvirus sp.]|uniref:Uncharacterized protein n=1 Tax=Hyperionvirus sp. TaxID=2487770 RepID=A0A3G5ABF4_9VIRU|nr:MAG: hypothetical protein Hyperionvirus9_8 [Hyperionvirus sp.]